MRGCLFVLLFAAVLIGGIAWFASGPIVAAAIGVGLQGSGYNAASTTIHATADPPPRLFLGQADRVSISGEDVDWRALHADHLDLTLDGVDLVARTADTIRGSIEGAALDDGHGGSAAVTSIKLSGPSDAAVATITIDPDAVRAAVTAAVASRFGVTPTDVQLVGPDRLRLVTPNATIEGGLEIDPSGALAFSTPLGSATLVSIDPTIPLRLQTVRVVNGALQLSGRLDVTSLLGG
jgi:hypothetical protein